MNGSQYWDKRAVKYSQLTKTKAFKKAYEKAIKLSGIDEKETNCILDICCGDGVLLSCALKRSSPKFVIGIDHSLELLRLAKENLKKAGACVSSKPVEVYARLAQLQKRILKGEKLIEEYRRVYEEHTSLKERMQGKPLGILLQRDMLKINFNVCPSADAVFFMFPVLESMASTNLPIKLDSALREVQSWSYHLYHFGNALNYLKPGGKLVVMLSIAGQKGKKPSSQLHKDIFNALQRLGCKISSFNFYRNKELADLFMNFYGYSGMQLCFIETVFTRTEDTKHTKELRKDITATCLNVLNVFEDSKGKKGFFAQQVKDRLIIGGKKRQFDMDEVLIKLNRLTR